MDYEIKITIEDSEGNQVFKATNNSVEMAVQELYRFERHVLPQMKKEDNSL